MKPKLQDEVIEEDVSRCLPALVFGRVGLGEHSEVIHDNKYLFETALAVLKVDVVDGYKLEWLGGADVNKGCPCLLGWLLLHGASAHLGDVVLYLSSHMWPVESLPSQMNYSLRSKVSCIVMELRVDKLFEPLRYD